MKPLHVTYDISFCARLHGQGTTGVGRVIESIATRLIANPALALALTGCRGGDPRPALTNAEAALYCRERWPDAPFLPAIRSRSGAPSPEELLRLNHTEATTFPARLRRRGANALARWRTAAALPAGGDLFHSPFFALPSRRITGERTRLQTLHDLIPLDAPETDEGRKWLEAMLDAFDPERDWAIAVSEATRHRFCEVRGVAAERVAVIPLAAEPFFTPQPEAAEAVAALFRTHQRPPQPFFLTVANPQPRKNLPFLLRAFAEADLPGVTLVVAGSGKLGSGWEPLLAEQARHPSLSERLLLLDPLDDATLARLYAACTAFLFPSLDEGFGLPPLEAMQSGAPVLCSHAASLPEVVGEAALLLDPRDLRSWVEALRAIATDPALRTRLTADGLARARQFSWEKSAAATAAWYEEIHRRDRHPRPPAP